MAKILMVVASNRQGSFNRQLADVIVSEIGDRAEVKFLDYSALPPMDQDAEFPAPEAVTKVRQEIKDADGLWIVSPQYNNSYPGVLKNLLDWVSRPVEAGDRDTAAAAGVKVTLSSIAGGNAAAPMLEKLSELVEFIGMDLLKEQMNGFIVPMEAWTNGIVVLTDEDKARVAAQVDAFLDFIA